MAKDVTNIKYCCKVLEQDLEAEAPLKGFMEQVTCGNEGRHSFVSQRILILHGCITVPENAAAVSSPNLVEGQLGRKPMSAGHDVQEMGSRWRDAEDSRQRMGRGSR